MKNTNLLSFHNDPAIKVKYVKRVKAHAAADRLVQGLGWEHGKGCAIGCTLEAYDHSRYPIELGLPEWLARLEDAIFEGLPKEDAMTWPQRFLEAIPVGVDVERVRHQLAIRRLQRLVAVQESMMGKHAFGVDDAINQVIAAIQQVAALHEAEMNGKTCDWSAARSAWSAAESAAESARSAAESARSAARSAESAAGAAWSAAFQQEAANLLELLAACSGNKYKEVE